jgi:hypothetical protein
MVRGPLPAFRIPLVLALLAPFVLAGRARAVQLASAPSSAAVNDAIERGVAYLLRSQNRDGSFGVDLNERGLAWHDLRDGATALALYTLLECGLAPTHPALVRARAFLLESTPRHTYAAGILLHAFAALGEPALAPRMRALTELLVELRQSGGWDYPGLGRADLSNTQVAALGLRAAHAAGLALPRGTWSELAGLTLRFQERPRPVPGPEQRAGDVKPKDARRMAGFAYEPGGAPSASMTTAGLTILGILAEEPGRVDRRLADEIDEARALALEWLAQHFDVRGNPGGEEAWHHYYLYGLERVGALFGLRTIGGRDWYAEGSARLLAEQREDGGWRSEGRSLWPPAPMPIANTCFGLLFLRKATLSPPGDRRTHFASVESAESDVWVRVDAEATWTAWLSGFAPAASARLGAGFGIERVEWWLDGERVAELAGDPSVPWAGERFALRHAPTRVGELVLECRVSARATDGARVELRSLPLAVRHELALEPWMLEYAAAARSNALVPSAWELTASSADEFHAAGDALDGLQGSAWWARADDPAPWLRLESERGVRLAELWLSPAAASETARASCVHLARLELRLNDAKAPLVVELEPDERLKTRVVLARPTLVRRIELRFVDLPREPGKHVGLAEIEAR